MACREPLDWMPNAFIQAVAYCSTPSSENGCRVLCQLDARDISGHLDDAELLLTIFAAFDSES